MSDKSISELLADLGLRHVRDDHTAADQCHSIFEGEQFVGRFDAHQAAKLIRVLASEDSIWNEIERRRDVAETGEEWSFICWLFTRLPADSKAPA